MTSFLLFLSLFVAPPPSQSADGDAPTPEAPRPGRVTALVIEQQANGLPNQPTSDPVLQRFAITSERLRLDDLQSGVAYLLQLDAEPPVLFEISQDARQYREGRQLDALQHARDRAERQLLRELQRVPAVEREAVMRDRHLRPNLERVVTVERPEGATDEILGRRTQRIVVKENGRTIVDGWFSEENFGIPFFEFYRRVGAFSEEVLEELRGIPGLPLRVTITVVTSTLNYEIVVEARDVRLSDVRADAFELPPGAEKVEDSPFAACPICGAQVERAAPYKRSMTREGMPVFFDRRECVVEFNRREYPERFGGADREKGRPGGR